MAMLAAQPCRDYGAPLRFRLEGAHDKLIDKTPMHVAQKWIPVLGQLHA
jgi:hypothetical protein